MAKDAIAVFDVGKTNKKVLIYDSTLKVVDRRYRHFDTLLQEGVEVEPLEDIRQWFLDTLEELAQDHAITSIGISTHGASVVFLDDQGDPVCPLVSYTHQPPEELHQQFFDALGSSREELQQRTATVELKPLINPAKLAFFCRSRWPREFSRVRHVLFLPQYFAWLLTGRYSSDYTYAGCHTYLWDFASWSWDTRVLAGLGLDQAVPPEPRSPWHPAGTVLPGIARSRGLSPETTVATGIHDSNASLLPYLLRKGSERFVLNSTGTWCVAMHPTTGPVTFRPDEVGKSVFYNISAFGDPVKTTILLGGLEFGTYREILQEFHGDHDPPPFNRALYQGVIQGCRQFIIPGVVPGTGQFPDSTPRIVDEGREYPLEDIRQGKVVPPLLQDLPRAYAVLNLSLALQSKTALERVGLAPGVSLFTEGGFRNNPDYNALLAAFFPESPLFLTNIEEATSLGAAITALAAREGRDPREYRDLFEIEEFPVPAGTFHGLGEYERAFRDLV